MKEIARLPQLYDAGGDIARDWHVYYSYRDPNTGKMKRFRVMDGLSKVRPEIFCTLTEAEKVQLLNERYARADLLILEWTEKLRTGYNPFNNPLLLMPEQMSTSPVMPARKRIADYLNEATKMRVSGRSRSTNNNYKRFSDNFIEWLQREGYEHLPIGMLQYGHVQRFLMSIVADGLSNKWRNEHLAYLTSCFKVLMRLHPDIVRANPFSLCEKLKHVRKQSPKFRIDMRERIREYLPAYDAQMWLFIQFVYYCGIRPGKELRVVQMWMIDLREGVLRLPAQHTKDGDVRHITLPVQLINQLMKLNLKQYPQNYYLFTSERKPGPNPISESCYRRRWRRFTKKHDIPDDYILYSFKHTGATAAVRSGIDMRVIQAQLGHSTLEQTEEYIEAWSDPVSDVIQNQFPDF